MAARTPIVIASAGVVTPVGLSLAETAASARSRVARLHEIAWRDRRFEPFIVGAVPDEGLPPLVDELAERPLQYRESRMLRLAHIALEEALTGTKGIDLASLGIDEPHPIPVLLGLPEHHTTIPLQPRLFLERLALQTGYPIDLAKSTAVPRGRAAPLMALREAEARLQRGDTPWVLVGGVDSLIDLYVLGTLDLEGRIRNEVNSDGFTPGEGAGFLLLTTESTARAKGLQPLARMLGSASGQESGHLYAEEPYLGEGLSATFAALLAAAPPPSPIGCVYASFNGERYWAREYGVARSRASAAFDPEHAMEHPAEVFGDLGAAHGIVMAAIAAHGVAHGYREPPCLVYAASDRADRAATLLDKLAA
ncbi:3-oxoacyl-ACP synthase [soil metagenome]